ncbi:MAG: hypothetical protein JWO13_461 [Acidobacteriales bacterium]|nr:hypothetical protein [Terriglobales bacterium]
MKKIITTAVTSNYMLLLPTFWHFCREYGGVSALRLLTLDSERHLLAAYLESTGLADDMELFAMPVYQNIPLDMASQSCALKLRIWEAMPDAKQHIFIDVDMLMLTWPSEFLETGSSKLFASRDGYIGFKEKMKDEFAFLNEDWSPCFDAEGRKYANTGLLISNPSHALFFANVLHKWAEFFRKSGKPPSIWDQNVFNYCLDLGRFGLSWNGVQLLDASFNSLKEYPNYVNLDLGYLSLNGEAVKLLHFNGGSPLLKYCRRARALSAMRTPSRKS